MSNGIDIYYLSAKDFDIGVTENAKFYKCVSFFAINKVKELARMKWNFKEEPEIERDKLGKPFFKNYSNCYFNISHSGAHVVIALSDSNVGVDIERIQKINPKIQERFFSKEEQKYVLNAKNNKVLVRRIFRIWTMKEAYVKYTGEGLNRSLKSFDVMESNLKKRITCFELNGCYVSICVGRQEEKIIKLYKSYL